MLEHDQNQDQPVPEEILKEGEGATSKATEEVTASEAEPIAEVKSEPEEAEAAPETPVEPETPAEPTAEENPQPEAQAEPPAEPAEPEAAAEEPETPAAEPTPPTEEPETPAVPEAGEDQPEAPAEEPAPKAAKTHEAHPDDELMNLLDEHDSSFRRGEIKEGTVVSVNDKDVVVDIGFKSDGAIPLGEFEYTGIPEPNSRILVFINDLDNGEGRLSLSKRKADFIKNIELIKQASVDGTILNGTIRRRVKGGMIVNVMGIEAFLPGSHMSLKPIPNLDQFIGKELQFKVMNIDEEHRNIILSRKMVLEEEASVKRQELLSRIEVDSELDGEVKNITQYGAFIDLGGIDGLLHLTDMSWGKINHPTDMLNIGDKVKVKVIKFDPETNKISLGLKQLVPHPWENVAIKYPEGVHVTGKVVSVKSFGAFVELEPGVEGLVHISEMSWTRKITDARKIVKIGDTVNAIVLELDKENRRISLGMKQMEANPWLSIEDHYPIGSVITRPVKSLTAFGAFVEVEDGIDGLIHISDISWTKRIYHPREVYHKGQEVEAVILSIDRALHRIALGVKQLHPDPWEHLNDSLPINTEVKGKISKLIPKGVLVDIEVGEDVVEGFIPISHLAIPKLEHSEEAFHAGEELPLKVIELDMENRRLILSVKAFFFSRDPKLQEEYIALHEQYMRDRIARLQKKRAERQAREQQREEAKAAALAAAAETPAEGETEAPAEAVAEEEAPPTPAEEAVETPAEEAVTESTAVEEPVEEPVSEEIPVEAPAEPEPEEVPTEEPAIEEIPEEVPTEEPAIEEIPEEVPTEEPAIEEIPEEVPTEEALVEEAVTEETPAGEPVEEALAEEAPSEEPAEETVSEEAEVEPVEVLAEEPETPAEPEAEPEEPSAPETPEPPAEEETEAAAEPEQAPETPAEETTDEPAETPEDQDKPKE
ncbi:MAG: 30S ribosomal protein S1 [Candidatus Cloacimonetes bacterium]|nr:30S ribosomal protein S1 [Candidatus Cloacimonadota bacterium]